MVEYIAARQPQYGIALRRSLLGGQQHICKPGMEPTRFQCALASSRVFLFWK